VAPSEKILKILNPSKYMEGMKIYYAHRYLVNPVIPPKLGKKEYNPGIYFTNLQLFSVV
jgi:hypothetical protein